MDKILSPLKLSQILRDAQPFIDVRAPVEFAQGHLPNAVNLPILNDEERAQVGTVYKKEGSERATALGYQLISGSVKEDRVQKWLDHLREFPNSIIYCFRGGQRSRIAQEWIAQAGIERPRLEGGYKKARQFLLEQISEFADLRELVLVSGATGSGKTVLLHELKNSYPTLNLEQFANHRGSVFGEMETPQPSQANFENILAGQLMPFLQPNFEPRPVLVEDESRMIGKLAIPNLFFERMRSSKVIWIEAPLEERIEMIFDDYILKSKIGRSVLQPKDEVLRESALNVFEFFKRSIHSISRKLGGLAEKEITLILEECKKEFQETNSIGSNKKWIERMLIQYYDPLYNNSIARRKVEIIFRGNRAECADFLRSFYKSVSFKSV